LDQAVSSLRTALFWNNSLIEGYIALGKIYLEKKDCLQAQNYSRSASELDADNEQAAALQRSVERCSK
jgi:cytochrome c-type biogenesis protein CcmH/NrfG